MTSAASFPLTSFGTATIFCSGFAATRMCNRYGHHVLSLRVSDARIDGASALRSRPPRGNVHIANDIGP